MRAAVVYSTVTVLGFVIMTSQVILARLLTVLVGLPFFATSFCFLGLSAAGAYCYARFYASDAADTESRVARYSAIAASLLMAAVFLMRGLDAAKNAELVRLAEDGELYWDTLFVNMHLHSLLLGMVFVAVFYHLGVILSLLYKHHAESANRLYMWDLFGAGAGCLAGALSLQLLSPSSVLIVLCGVLYLHAACVAGASSSKGRVGSVYLGAAGASIAVLIANGLGGHLELRPNPSFLARDWGLEKSCTERRREWNTFSRVALVECEAGGERNALFAIDNAEGHASLPRFDPGARAAAPIADVSPVAMPFLLREPENVLVLFAGAGSDMVEAHAYSGGRAKITGVEINPLIVEMAREAEGYGLDAFYSLDHVDMVTAEGRSYIEGSDEQFDAIVLSWSGASAADFLGVSGYTGRYLYTREAFVSFFEHLAPDGLISIVNLNKIKVIATVRAAMEEIGVEDFASHVAIFESRSKLAKESSTTASLRAWDHKKVLIKKSPFTERDIEVLSARLAEHDLEWIYNPGFSHPAFALLTSAITTPSPRQYLAELEKSVGRNFSLPTDDAPFVNNMFSFAGLTGRRFDANWATDRAFRSNIFIIAFLGMLVVAGALLVLVPLLVTRSQRAAETTRGSARILAYFATLGAAFILVEIGVMQQFVLVLGNPIYSLSVVLASLLVATGLGSMVSTAVFDRGGLSLRRNAVLCFGLLAGYYFVLPGIAHWLMQWSLAFKITAVIALLLPMGISMGMLFPQGLRQLEGRHTALIPWAWGMNGYMSIIGSGISIYLSLAVGFSALLLFGGCLYLAIAVLDIEAITSVSTGREGHLERLESDAMTQPSAG